MNFSQVFNFATYYVAIFWAGMIIFPNWSITKRVMNSYLPFFPLIFLYIYYLVITTDLESLAGAFIPNLSEYAKLFGQEGGALVVTVHFLAMDLFVGRWIYWQGQEKKIWTAHSLALCLFFGPVGLLSHLITNTLFGNHNDDSEAEKDSNVVS